MTEKQLREKPVKWLSKFLGCEEGSPAHREIIKVFNDSGLCPRYQMTIYDAWCATAVSAAFIATKLTKIFPCVECACSAMISKAKAAGIWCENDAHVPKVGDVIFYDWEDSGAGDNKGDPDHVGIVAGVVDGSIRVVEGNMGRGTVGYRTIPLNGQFIRGFILPKYSTLAKKEKPTLDKKGYKKGDRTIGVLAFKCLLILAKDKGIIKQGVDFNGTFGNGTEKAVNKFLKKWGYKRNGIAGKNFIKKLETLLKK